MRVRTFTRADFDADPLRVVRATRRGPVEVVDEDGQRVMYLTRPKERP